MECPHTTSPLHSSSVITKTATGIIQQSKNGTNIVPTPANVGSQTINILLTSYPSITAHQNPQSATNIGIITGVATTIVLVVVIIVLTLTVVGAIAICRQNQHKTEVPTVSNEAYGTVPKNLAVHIKEDTYDYIHTHPNMNQQATDSINTTQNEAYVTNTEVVQSMSHYL